MAERAGAFAVRYGASTFTPSQRPRAKLGRKMKVLGRRMTMEMTRMRMIIVQAATRAWCSISATL
jgi:hypothetical protein